MTLVLSIGWKSC